MDSYEATKVVYSRIQNLDPENASKIIGLLLIQDHAHKQMIRLAFGPDSLLHSLIFKARKDLGISSNTSSAPSTPSSPSPFPFSPSLSRHNSSSSWTNVRSGSSPPAMNSSAQPFYCGREADLNDEYFNFQEHLSFLNDESPELASSPSYGVWHGGPHRRSFSVNDIMLGGADDQAGGGFGWKTCLYYAKGYCKNGTSCRFVHGRSLVDSDEADMVGSPSKLEVMEQCQELFRSKSAHQHRLAAASQLMGGSSNFPFSSNKCMNHFLHQQKNDSPRAAAALMSVRNRNEFLMGMGMVDPGSMQIYLTFPADSSFKEEDVSNYFSIYGPVQDVRIPYQQKRMFGFVTFVYPETVRLILAKGNPHFVCDSRVLVKPYKEKGKVPDKFRKQQQLMEREEYSSSGGSPTSFKSGDPFDIQLEAGILYKNQQEMLWRRKLEEQANLQQAIELQNRRLMSLQLLDLKRNHHHCAAISSPEHSPSFLSHSSFLHSYSDRSSPEEDDDLSGLGMPVIVNVDDHQTVNGFEKEREKEKGFLVEEEGMSNSNGNGKSSPHHEESDFQESMEHNLPDSLFASPKAASSLKTAFSTDIDEVDKNCNGSLVVPASLSSNNLITSPFLSA